MHIETAFEAIKLAKALDFQNSWETSHRCTSLSIINRADIMQDFITLISSKMQIITFQNGGYLCVSFTRQQGQVLNYARLIENQGAFTRHLN